MSRPVMITIVDDGDETCVTCLNGNLDACWRGVRTLLDATVAAQRALGKPVAPEMLAALSWLRERHPADGAVRDIRVGRP